MAVTEQVSRTGILADVMARIVDAVRPHDRFTGRRGARKLGHHPRGWLAASILRDIGAGREHQDYKASAADSAGSNRRLHRIAEAARWTSPG